MKNDEVERFLSNLNKELSHIITNRTLKTMNYRV